MIKEKKNKLSSEVKAQKIKEVVVKNKKWPLEKIVRVIPYAFILGGILLSGFSLTGNVVGSLRTGLSSFGAGFFVVGVIGLLVSVKKD